MIKSLLKFFLLGWVGLLLTLAYPQILIGWLAIVLAHGMFRLSWWGSLILLSGLSLLYADFSWASPWWVGLPYLFAYILFLRIRRNLSVEGTGLWILLALLWTAPWIFWNLWGWVQGGTWSSVWQMAWGMATLVLGAWVLPALFRKVQGLWAGWRARRRTFSGQPRWENIYRPETQEARFRKPFGWEQSW